MRISLAVVIWILLIAGARADHTAQVDRLVQPLLDSKTIVGCVVGVIDNGWQEVHGYGEIHKGAGDKPNGDTEYEIGSITKTFTGTLLADMVNRGLLKLDDPVQKFLPPNVKLHLAEGTPIRLVDLASQSSGLPRMPDNISPRDPRNPYVDYTPKRMFEFLSKHKLRRPPGEYEYSNLGVGLLGYILAQQAGKSYEAARRRTSLRPIEDERYADQAFGRAAEAARSAVQRGTGRRT